jgi:hypothetical protein
MNVKSYPNFEEGSWDFEKLYFQDGNVSFIMIGDDDRNTFPYTFIDGIINSWNIEFKVVKLTNKVLIADMYCDKSSIFDYSVSEYDIAHKDVFYTYNGVKVYSCGGRDERPFWYYNDKGEVITCRYHKYLSSSSNGERTYDYWYDTERYYCKAE